MNYLTIYKDSVNDGPGFRVSLYIAGCRNHCPDCHNPESWDFSAGKLFNKSILNEILGFCSKNYINGLTIAGGEPMEEENQRELLTLVEAIKTKLPSKDIWCFTGYEFNDLLPGGKKHCEVTEKLLSYIDVLIVGPFILAERDISDDNRWRGSRNQRVLDLPKSLENGKPIMLEGIPNND